MKPLTRKRKKELGLAELIAIALGGMVGGGIFSILGVSVEHIGDATPIAILIGGVLALFAAYSYVKLALLYKDEGATYSFFNKTFPEANFASTLVGWFVVFGYISTLALYAFTFASYFCSVVPFGKFSWANEAVAGTVILAFAIINLISVKGMGKLEDWMVYTKIVILLVISGMLASKAEANAFELDLNGFDISNVLMVSSITFVAFEGFQLVIHAYNEMDDPQRNIPRAIYSSIAIAVTIYIALALAALAAIPNELIIQNKEYALAAGAEQYLGKFGLFVVIFGALLATSSAISGTLFGASRLMAVIADDHRLPSFLTKRIKQHIPSNAIVIMSVLAVALILSGGLQVILEFGSITFIIVSFLMAYSNFKVREKTGTRLSIAIIAMVGLFAASLLIFYFEFSEAPEQMTFIFGVYLILLIGAFIYSRKKPEPA